MNVCITPDATDRAKTGGLRMMFANVASMLTLIIAVPLITSLGDGPADDGRVLVQDRRAMDPARFAHLRRDLGLDAPDDAPAR